MDISIMTVSIPIDIETLEEIQVLVYEASKEDQISYGPLLSMNELNDSFIKGFCVLAYDDEEDKLVGVVSSVDRIATLDFEWSAVVLPRARRKGIGEQLLKELTKNLELRGAATDLALVPKTSVAGHQLVKKYDYAHDFSEITMVANAEETSISSNLTITPYATEELELIKVLTSAFGDTPEEARELITFNTETPNRRLMIASLENEVVGTVTLVEDSDKLYVTGLAVHENARGKGVATSLLNWCKNEAYRLGKTKVYLDVETENEQALSIYNKAGFQMSDYIYFYQRG